MLKTKTAFLIAIILLIVFLSGCAADSPAGKALETAQKILGIKPAEPVEEKPITPTPIEKVEEPSQTYIVEYFESPLAKVYAEAKKSRPETTTTLNRVARQKTRIDDKNEQLQAVVSAQQGQITRKFYNTFSGVAVEGVPFEELKRQDFVKRVVPDKPVKATLTDSIFKIKAEPTWKLNCDTISDPYWCRFNPQLPECRRMWEHEAVDIAVQGQKEQETGINFLSALTEQTAYLLTAPGSEYCNRGQDISIGIIDSGVDYLHKDLGGCFGPSCKVVGGYDFVNDDSDPMDDYGHGTHVAAIAAGKGLIKHYEPNVKDELFWGIAPDAIIYAYKVLDFQGNGQASDVIAAIDRSVDPNQDGDFSDHLHIINISFGADCGGTYSDSCGPNSPMSLAVDNAYALGVLPVVAAGNNGPTASSITDPGTAKNALTVGFTNKNKIMSPESSRGPVIWTTSSGGPGSGGIGIPRQKAQAEAPEDMLSSGSSKQIIRLSSEGEEYWLLKPDVVAPGVSICAAQAHGTQLGSTCGEDDDADNERVLLSGSSEAAAHVAGVAALRLQYVHRFHPDYLPPLKVKSPIKSTAQLLLRAGEISIQGLGLVNSLATAPSLMEGLSLNPIPQQGRHAVITGDSSIRIITLSYAPFLPLSQLQESDWQVYTMGGLPFTGPRQAQMGEYLVRLKGATTGGTVLQGYVDYGRLLVDIPQCQDGLDNEWQADGVIDTADPGCWNDVNDPITYDPSLDWEAAATTQCQDEVDNDGDGLTDDDDPGCWEEGGNYDFTQDHPSFTYDFRLHDESVATSHCQDGSDNDADPYIDYPNDAGCQSPQDYSEVSECQDGLDNDFDLLTDEDDPGCWDDIIDPGTYNQNLNREAAATTKCQDGIDNDTDRLTDFWQDPGCESRFDQTENSEPVIPECRNGEDDDSDGFFDYGAPYGYGYECSDGIDNDGDGLTDDDDPGCSGSNDNSEYWPLLQEADPECESIHQEDEQFYMTTQCNNGVDDDGDGYIDYAVPVPQNCQQSDLDASGEIDERDWERMVSCITQPDLPARAECSNANLDGDNDVDVVDYAEFLACAEVSIADRGCSGWYDNSEAGPVTECNNGVDDDSDGFTDFPDDGGCVNSQDSTEGYPSQCNDWRDNDGDGHKDYPQGVRVNCAWANFDSDLAVDEDDYAHLLFCFGAGLEIDEIQVVFPPECSNADWDGDGAVDLDDFEQFQMCLLPFSDRACSSLIDNSESGPVTQCSDGIDNDGDGFCDTPRSSCTDGSLPGDTSCISSQHGDENFPNNPLSPLYCMDIYSNDGDIYIDDNDPGCMNFWGSMRR